MKITIVKLFEESLIEAQVSLGYEEYGSKEEIRKELDSTGSENEQVVSHEEISEPRRIIALLNALLSYGEAVEDLEDFLTRIYQMGVKEGMNYK